MALFSLQKFISEIRSRGVARPTKFEVIMASPNILFLDDVILTSMMCEITTLPSLNISVASQRIYGPNYQNPISVDYGGEAITMTFYVDREMRVKKFFDAWMNYIVNSENYNPKYQNGLEGQYDRYTADIRINQLDDLDRPTYSIKLLKAFPRNMGIMELNSSSQNTPHRLNVTFAYRKWIPIKENEG